MNKYVRPLLFLFIVSGSASAQITPPSMTHQGSATWTALGVSQQLKNRSKSVMVYTGLGTGISRMENKPKGFFSMWVLNAEYKSRFSGPWYASGALSYRRHRATDPPEAEELQQELRLYGSLGGKWKWGDWNGSLNFRPELRSFYNRSFEPEEDFMRLRYRLRMKVGWHPAGSMQHLLSVSAEGLCSSDVIGNKGPVQTAYEDTRYCLYYSYSPSGAPITFELGYMTDVRVHHSGTSGYLALDIVWKNPFHT